MAKGSGPSGLPKGGKSVIGLKLGQKTSPSTRLALVGKQGGPGNPILAQVGPRASHPLVKSVSGITNSKPRAGKRPNTQPLRG